MPLARCTRVLPFALTVAAAITVAGVPHASAAQQPSPRMLDGLRWRMIGPFRGGRTKAATGVRGQPNVFYIGATNGGVWRSTDYGRTWAPIFDDQPTGSIGAIAVAPSDPNVLYVGSGEGLQRPDLSTGDGIYKSTDGGKSWAHLGLRDGQQIPQIIVDPRNPNRLFVAVLGHPYGPNAERGIFRSTDGGKTFEKVLYRDENTGAVDVAFSPRDPSIVYAVLWESRQAPWENGVFNGPGSGLYKSTDGGATWRHITNGLPTFEQDGLGRIGITVAPSDPNRMYATVEVKENDGNGLLFRSDDAGEHWYQLHPNPLVVRRPSDFAEVKVDPKNADVVYTASVVTWKSTDGGRSFTALRGAPGGDDYHRIWINPDSTRIMLIASDQGAIVTVNGGVTWSSWYNQPTAQMYHVSADNAFPYRVCGGQQESGSACVASRGDDGAITFRDWHPVGAEEYGYVTADPRDPDIVYGGKLSRYDRRTGLVQNVAPRLVRSKEYRVLRTAPVIVSPHDPALLYFASNVLWRTTNGGTSWTQMSPDLTRRDSVIPPNVGVYATQQTARTRHPGVIYTVAPSYVSKSVIWAGSDDGLISVTRDGGRTWAEVTPPELRARPWSKVSLMDASHFDALTAYAAVNTFRLDDLRPHIFRTRDGGRTWSRIVSGIPDSGIINVVREDPRRRGLLFAGSEREVYVSFDDGDHWQSLRRNMPASSIRDLVIKDDDIVVGTHGRSIWIMDDIEPLRQLTAATADSAAVLFRPQVATRFRWNKNTDTPLPPDEPLGQNPPDGAIVDYWLRGAVRGAVTLEILDAHGGLVRRFASTDTLEKPVPTRNIPDYWIRPPRVLSADAGMHRFVWDLHFPPPRVSRYDYPISAAPHDTPREPRGPWAVPGRYTVRLSADGRVYTQPLVVRADPRLEAPSGLVKQFALASEVARMLDTSFDAIQRERAARGGRDSTEDETSAGGGPTLSTVHNDLLDLYALIEGADAAPTTQMTAAVVGRRRALDSALARHPPARAAGRQARDGTGLGSAARLSSPSLRVPSRDSVLYTALFSDRAAGRLVSWRDGVTRRYRFEYNDRGRGPRIEERVTLGPDGVPRSLEVLGHGYFKDTVSEHLGTEGRALRWANTVDGVGADSAAGPAFYVSAGGAPAELALLARALLLARGHSIRLLPGGTARLQRIAARSVSVPGGPRSLTLYGVSGLGFSPALVWLDTADLEGERFASVSSWLSVVPAGWERAAPTLLAVQDSASTERLARLGRSLAHRPRGPVVFRHARLFDAARSEMRPGMSVVVQGNRIRAVGRDGSVAAPAGAQVVDATGKTLLPGLWDMHVHVSPTDDGFLHIAAGVTSARDMGNDTTVARSLQRKFANGTLVGPRLHLAGLIDAPGPYQVPIGVLDSTESGVRRWVNWYADHGYEQIKIYSSMKPRLVPVIAAEAHRRGLRVSGHVPAYMTAEEVVRDGYDEIQHANMLLLNFMDSVKDTRSMARFTAVANHGAELDFDSQRVKRFVALLRDHHTVIDPTLVTFEGMFTTRAGQMDPSASAIADRVPPQVRRGFLTGGLPHDSSLDRRFRDSYDAMLRMVKTLHDAGVRVVAGTDAMPGFMLHRELELYVRAGIPAASVLRIATLGAAEVMKRDDELGSVAVGKLADLVLVDGDPSANISDIRNTRLVMKDGTIYRPEELYRVLGVRP